MYLIIIMYVNLKALEDNLDISSSFFMNFF